MTSKKKLVAEGKQRLNEKLASVEEQAAYMHKFIDDIISKPTSDARHLITENDKKSFLRHYSETNQELERCLDKMYLIRASLPALLSNDSDCTDEEDSASEKSEQRLIDQSKPVVLKPNERMLGKGKISYSDDVTSTERGISCPGSIVHRESKILKGVSETKRHPSIKDDQSSVLSLKDERFEDVQKCTGKAAVESSQYMQDTPAQVAENPKPLVLSSSTNTSNLFGGSTQQQDRVDSCQSVTNSSDFVHGMKYQPDAISRLLQQSAMQPRIPNTTFADDTVLDVLVTEVISPSIFWIQPVSSPLANLMHQISQAYSEGSGQMLTIPVIGMACCSCFTQDNCWYRARIIDIFPSGSRSEVEVKVVYVDYGNCERLPLSRLRYLLPELAVLPAQAVCAGLSRVKPPGIQTWTHEQTLFFVKLVVNQTLTAKVTVRSGTRAPLVDLTYNVMANQAGTMPFSEGETSPKIKVNVADLMIENKHAAPLIQNVPQTTVQQKSENPTYIEPPVSHDSLSSHSVTAHKEPVIQNPISRAKQICERLKQDKEARVHDSNEASTLISTNVKDQISKLSRSSSGVSSATNLSCSKVSPEINQASHQKDLGSSVGNTRATSNRPVIGTKNSNKVPNIPRMNIRINDEAITKVEVQSVKKGRGRGRGKHQRSTRSISDASSEDSIPGGLTAKRDNTPRTPSFQKDDVIEKRVVTKELNVKSTEIPSLPSSKSSSSPSHESLTKPIVVKPVNELTSLPERKLKFDANGCIDIAVSYVISPTEFYSHIISSDACKLDYLMNELNDHFATSSCKDSDDNFKVTVGSICSAKFSKDKLWYRVKVLETETATDSSVTFAHIHYVDFGNKEWIPLCDLRRLPSWFFDLPAQVIRCSLAHVSPKKRKKEVTEDALKEDVWSVADIEKFVELAGYLHRLTAKVITTDEKPNGQAYNMIVSSIINGKQTCINERLVTLGHADSEVFNAQFDGPVVKIDCSDIVDSPKTSSQTTSPKSLPSDTHQETNDKNSISPDIVDALEKWNPMTEDYMSQRNSYSIDVDDPGVATVGYKTERVHKICSFYARGDICYQGDSCQNLHSRDLGSEKVDAYWTDNPISLPEEGSCVAMQVTAYHSACHFWAHLPYGAKPLEDVKVERSGNAVEDEGETLQSLVDSINHIYGKSSHTHKTDLLLKAVGELVCAKHAEDNTWYRARVTSTNAEENTVEVFFLDYGNSEVVPESSLRPMLPQFLHLPFQAVECFLYNLEVKQFDGEIDEARRQPASFGEPAYWTSSFPYHPPPMLRPVCKPKHNAITYSREVLLSLNVDTKKLLKTSAYQKMKELGILRRARGCKGGKRKRSSNAPSNIVVDARNCNAVWNLNLALWKVLSKTVKFPAYSFNQSLNTSAFTATWPQQGATSTMAACDLKGYTFNGVLMDGRLGGREMFGRNDER
ncbi:uncharacterized protein LOC117100914 isoform X2 [Anneissia japonica]|uniref:uncharacterized protein LOC117100914 isoform X2 n=1 Tax=Anneissia japonica TaxID=1529436 RepID=UPI0014258F11|nr:uncharacterized protein LOC117100914 isoform X2 [Anneissia japonica]